MKFILSFFFILVSLFSYSQSRKDTSITWISYPYYDSLGNQTYYRMIFDHIPTKGDTLMFNHRIDLEKSDVINRKTNSKLGPQRKKNT